MNVNLQIDEISLDGLDVSQRHAGLIRSAMSNELQIQLKSTSLSLLSSRSLSVADPASLDFSQGGDVNSLGARLGRTIHQQVVGQIRG